tara:strand:- start:8125 stop:10215 length:2091 start_codon:yes stop_codon:yes gene_type:complete
MLGIYFKNITNSKNNNQITMAAFLDKHRCPITHEIMSDPVLAPDTYNYEREAIVRYLDTNPISPMTRQPMRANQLIENRELRQEIESLISAADTVTTEDMDQIMEDETAVCSGQIRTDGTLTQISTIISDGEAGPLSIAFVKDTSGSMNREVKTSDGETDGYNMLDIACHGTNVCINSLRPCDRAALVSFNSRASPVKPLKKMTPGNKAAMKVALAGLSPSGSTNLWDGIKTALEMLPDDGIVCVLTDGEPTVRPPKGEVRMFNEWRDAHPNWCGQIHTFGFGYSLDSQLLVDIARAGNGRYSFIPDSSLVGTVFVHSMANIRTTYASKCILSVETTGTIEGIGPHTKTSWGYQIPIGPLMFGQRRDYFLRSTSEMACSIEKIPLVPSGEPNASDERQRTALAIYDSLRVRPNMIEFASTITDPKLLEDINGQWKEAMQIDYFRRWGRHYLPSLAAAHMTQTCNNFLDKGIQTYGGARFHQLRDAFDKIFNDMPAPMASLRYIAEERARNEGFVMRSAPVTMASYNRCDGPCFPGFCKVVDGFGVSKLLSEVQKGDEITSPDGSVAVVQYVLKTMCPRGYAKCVKIGNLHATPYHPIKLSDKWVFPNQIGNGHDIRCEAIYSLLLNKPSCFIEGVECIGLSHGIENDDVATHAFFGTEKVREMLQILDDNDSGMVVLPGPDAIQRGSDGLVCGFVV